MEDIKIEVDLDISKALKKIELLEKKIADVVKNVTKIVDKCETPSKIENHYHYPYSPVPYWGSYWNIGEVGQSKSYGDSIFTSTTGTASYSLV